MGQRGPARKPTWLNLVQGNPSRRPLVDGLEAPKVTDAEKLPPPEYFSADEMAIWNDVVRILITVHALTDGDKFAIERYCVFLDMWRKGAQFMRDHSQNQLAYAVNDAKGDTKNMKLFPHLDYMARVSNQLLKLEQQFGFTPSARASFGSGNGPNGNREGFDPSADHFA